MYRAGNRRGWRFFDEVPWGSRCARYPFDLQPVLEGELLKLRPLQASDFDDLFAVAADPLIWEQHPAPDRYKEQQFRMFFRESLESARALIAIDRRDGRIIGSSRFHGYDREGSEIEIGWMCLARSHWGGRYNGEMKRLMLLHEFRFVNRVVFLVGAQNLRSQRAVEMIGGVRLESRPDEGGRENIVYQITGWRVSLRLTTTNDWRPTTNCEDPGLHCRQRRWLYRDPRRFAGVALPLGDIEATSYPVFIRDVGALAMGSATSMDAPARRGPEAKRRQPWPYQKPAWVFSSRPQVRRFPTCRHPLREW